MEEKYPIIDVHCHVLPGIDDGAETMEESMELLERAHEQGITSVIATPHDRGHGNPQKRAELRQCLQERIEKILPGFCIYSGSENYYHEGLAERILRKEAETLADSPYVLVEFHPAGSYGTMFRGIRSLTGAGYIPVLAHVERYACLRKDANLQELLNNGCRFQMNFESLQGRWFSSEVRWCRRQVLEGRIYLLGTDMHRLDFRPPDIRAALAWLEGHVDSETRRRMLFDNAAGIIEYNDKK